MVLPASRRISRVPRYLGIRNKQTFPFCLRDFHPLWSDLSRSLRLCKSFFTARHGRIRILSDPATPRPQRNRAYMCAVWALSLSLAATQGISIDFFSWRYLDVSVPSVRSTLPIDSAGSDSALPEPGFPIRTSPGLRSFAPHRGLSQLTTSFIAYSCQGIHHMLLVT